MKCFGCVPCLYIAALFGNKLSTVLDALNLHVKMQKMQWEVRTVAARGGGGIIRKSMEGIRSVVTTPTWHTAGQPGPRS
jgi:hypothetical protein